jgi:hypothetical protein
VYAQVVHAHVVHAQLCIPMPYKMFHVGVSSNMPTAAVVTGPINSCVPIQLLEF